MWLDRTYPKQVSPFIAGGTRGRARRGGYCCSCTAHAVWNGVLRMRWGQSVVAALTAGQDLPKRVSYFARVGGTQPLYPEADVPQVVGRGGVPVRRGIQRMLYNSSRGTHGYSLDLHHVTPTGTTLPRRRWGQTVVAAYEAELARRAGQSCMCGSGQECRRP
jgi:hypothetical protein